MSARRRARGPLLLVDLDRRRGLALLRGGPAADRAAWLLSSDDRPPRRHPLGLVVDLRVGLDATGWAAANRVPCVVHEVPP